MATFCSHCLAEVTATAEVCGRCEDGRPEGGWGGDPLVGRLLAERYRLGGRIGTGAMGFVYRARDERLETEVAVKLLRPELATPLYRRRFEREARLAARLASPHAVRVFDFGALDDGALWLAMEFVDGRTLEPSVASGRGVPIAWALDVMAQVADALGEAHRIGAVHRDVKPANILLTDHRRGVHARLTDFGVAVLDPAQGPRLTRAGLVQGTPRYMSPEQALGDVDLDGRSDLYALGVIGYELLAGRPIFPTSAPVEMMMAQVHEEPEPLDATPEGTPIPAEVRALIGRLLAKDREARFQDAEAVQDALVAALERLRSGGAEALVPAGPAPARPRPPTDLPLAPPPRTRSKASRQSTVDDLVDLTLVGAAAAGAAAAPAEDDEDVAWPPPRRWPRARVLAGLALLGALGLGASHLAARDDHAAVMERVLERTPAPEAPRAAAPEAPEPPEKTAQAPREEPAPR